MERNWKEGMKEYSYLNLIEEIKKRENLPVHVAIIMDGNGRWAKKQGLPRYIGHRHGVERIREILEVCRDLGITFLTLYTFSTENWRRPQSEVNFLMDLILETIKKEYEELHRNKIRVRILGDLDGLPEKVFQEIKEVVSATNNYESLTLSLALNYGGRSEIIEGMKVLYQDLKRGVLSFDDFNEETFSSYLYTAGMPDPELLIRTGGEWRLSNFLLWQLAYAEFLISKTYWPDFSKEEFCLSILEYQGRERRFGGI